MTNGQLNQTEVQDQIREYIRENFLYMRPDFELNDDDQLLKKGVVDSMGVVEVLEFLRDDFGVEIEDDEITEENLGSIAAMASFVHARL